MMMRNAHRYVLLAGVMLGLVVLGGSASAASRPRASLYTKTTLTHRGVERLVAHGERLRLTAKVPEKAQVRLFVYARALRRGGMRTNVPGSWKVFISPDTHVTFDRPGVLTVTLHVDRADRAALLRAGTIIEGFFYAGYRSARHPASARLRWTDRQPTDFAGKIALGSMVCPSTSVCQALDADGRLVQFSSDPNQPAPNDLSSQHSVIGLHPPAPLVALACPGAGQCTALDRAGSVTTFLEAAQSFRFTRVDHAVSQTSADAATGLACASTTRCVVVDGAGGVVSFSPADPSAGTRVELDPGTGPGLSAVTCPSATQCTAIGGTREWTFDPSNPAAARVATVDAAPAAVSALACSSATQCTAVDGAGRETTFDPQTTAGGTPVAVSSASSPDLFAVVCPTASLCTAADRAGDLESFEPVSGVRISTVPAPAVDDLACISGTYCLADQSNGEVLPFDAGSAQDLSGQQVNLDSGSRIVSLACPAADRCVAVDPIHQIRFQPHPTQRPSFGGIYGFPYSAHDPITGLACPQLTRCTAVRGDQEITFDVNRAQHLQPRVIDHHAGASITAVRCPTAKQCTAIDTAGEAITYDPANGHILRGQIAVENGHPLTALGCPSATQCTATDNDGHAISFDPRTGRRLLQMRIDAKVGLDAPGSTSGQELDAITCEDARACAAVDTLGDVVTFNPRSRRGVHLHRYDTTSGLSAISCPGREVCMAAGSDGRVYYGQPNASRWTSTPLMQASALTAIDCESTTVCVVADDAGDTYTSHAK